MQTSISQPPVATQLCVMPTSNGHAMPLTAEEFPIYHLHITRFFTELRPQGDRESALVQRIADNEWRTDRLARIEMGIYALGQLEFAHLFADQDAALRSLLIQTHTHKNYARQISSLNAQESRLRRYVEKDIAELRQLQAERQEREAEKKTAAASATTATAADPQQNGFEFSNPAATLSNEKGVPVYTNGKASRQEPKPDRHN